MTDYNTGNPVPSLDPRDLDDNAKVFDRLMNGTGPSYPDRLGALRKSWYQLEQDAAALSSPNVSALAAAVSAANKLFYFTGAGTGAVTDFSDQARAFCAATTQLAQRTAIGAGTAATLDQTTSVGDTTVGRALRVADHGVGSMQLATAADVNTLSAMAFLRTSPSTLNRPGGISGAVCTLPYATGASGGQLYLDSGGGLSWRWNTTLGDGTWRTTATAGVNSNITSLTGLTTALSVSQGGTGGATKLAAGSALGVSAVGTNTTELAQSAMVQAEIANKRAWTNFTPAVVATSGTFTSVTAGSGRYMVAFGICHVEIRFTVTTKGTGATPIVGLPVAAKAASNQSLLHARENAINGKLGCAVIAGGLTTAFVVDYATGDLVTADGAVIAINGTYPVA
ncbi:hypothetical protein D3C80_1107250 [compost metagenome]